MKKPVLLMILDGWGLRKEARYNAPKTAHTPNMDMLWKSWPHSRLKASGKDVGVPAGFQGNSEVGHLNIGAGRIVFQSIEHINQAIRDKSFFKNKAYLAAIKNCKKNDSTLHLMGLVQREGVHAMSDHLVALVKLAKMHGLKDVCIHAFTDGRDSPAKSAGKHIGFVQKELDRLETGKIVSVMGRFYSMDRDNRWNRIKIAYDCLMHGKGKKVKSWKEALSSSYQEGDTDEFIKPRIIGDFKGISKDDSVIHFNYRLDRPRELTMAMVEPGFNHFKTRKKQFIYVCTTYYYKDVDKRALVAFQNVSMKNILGEVILKSGLKQLRIAETEKYAHVTFFFNSLIDKPFKGEDRILIHSPRDVKTYDLKPEMSAPEICEALLKELGKHDVIILNFANGDMVGHTGVYSAAKKAVEAVDTCIGKIIPKILEKKGKAIIIADHGNCEEMFGIRKTSHTLNPVPCILVGTKGAKLRDGRLADVAPTILDLLDIKKPKEMTGTSLIK